MKQNKNNVLYILIYKIYYILFGNTLQIKLKIILKQSYIIYINS